MQTRGASIGRGAVTANGNHTFVRSAIARRLTDQMKRIVFLALALPMILGYPAKAQLPVKKVLTLEVAKKIAAEVEAKKRGATVVIVVVDDGGRCSSGSTIHRSPVWRSGSAKLGRPRFSAAQARCLKIRSVMVV